METAYGNPATAGKLRGLEGLFVTDYSITHLLTHSWSRALLEKLPTVQLLKIFPAFY
jgi:hypothetical protein